MIGLETFQSTLSQGERHKAVDVNVIIVTISIHALARRATDLSDKNSGGYGISIHALARRATRT